MDQSWKGEKWDWYCLEKPKVTRKDTNGKVLSQKVKLSGIESILPHNMHRIEVPGLQAVHWTYRDKNPSLVCNGILIPSGEVSVRGLFDESQYIESKTHLELNSPNISVFDPNGRLPLDLARRTLASSYSQLNSCIVDDLCRNFIAYALLLGPNERMLFETNFNLYSRPSYTGLCFYEYWRRTFGCFFDTADGFGLTDPWNISHYISGVGLLIKLRGNNTTLTP
jgi:hypothetical protein